MISVNILENKPLFVINHILGSIEGIDKQVLVRELENSQSRLVENRSSTQWEDFLTLATEGTEAKKVIDGMAVIGDSLGYSLGSYWHHVHYHRESSDNHKHYDKLRDIELSWVYYVQIPEDSGNLIFFLDDGDVRAPLAVHEPVEGTFVIFPSYLKHRVDKNMSNQSRISIAGDFIPKGGRGYAKPTIGD